MELDWLKDTALTALNDRKLAMLSAGAEIADLSMINPDLAPPRLLVDKLMELTARSTNHRYAVARGVRRLREAFAHKYSDRFGVRLDPENEVCVTQGSKDALEQVLRVLALSAAGASRRVVAVAAPFYPHYRAAALLNGFEFRTLPFTGNGDSRRDEDQFLDGCAGLPRGSALLLNFPHNPTGRVAPRSFYERLVPIVLERDLFLINDFVYGELVYSGAPAISILSLPSVRERCVEFYSLSKAYSVPGWRVGAVLGASAVVNAVSTLKSHIDYGIFLPIQGAAAAALHAPSTLIAPLVEEYARRSRTLAAALRANGWEVDAPAAGCAVWARHRQWGIGTDPHDSFALARTLLEAARVSCSPGSIFMRNGVETPSLADSSTPSLAARHDWIRFALVAPEGQLRMIVDRISEALRDVPRDVLRDGPVSSVSREAIQR